MAEFLNLFGTKPNRSLVFSDPEYRSLTEPKPPSWKQGAPASISKTMTSNWRPAFMRLVFHDTQLKHLNRFIESLTYDCSRYPYYDGAPSQAKLNKLVNDELVSIGVDESMGLSYAGFGLYELRSKAITRAASMSNFVKETVAHAARNRIQLAFGYPSKRFYWAGEHDNAGQHFERRVLVRRVDETGFLGEGFDGVKRYNFASMSNAVALGRPRLKLHESHVVAFALWGKRGALRLSASTARFGEPIPFGVRRKGLNTWSFDQPRDEAALQLLYGASARETERSWSWSFGKKHMKSQGVAHA